MTRNNPDIERIRRMAMAYLLATNPKTFKILAENNINLFHGTNANALPSILKYGMNSIDESSKKGISVSTGEEWSRLDGRRDFISFTDVLFTATDYACMPSSNEEANKKSFGVLFGISSKDLKEMRTCRVASDLSEVGIVGNVPLEYIKVIAVPKSKVRLVRKMNKDRRIAITSIDIDERLQYYIEDLLLSFNLEKAKEFLEGKKRTQIMPIFETKEVKDLALTRKKSGILNFYQKLKDEIRGEGKNKDDTREE